MMPRLDSLSTSPVLPPLSAERFTRQIFLPEIGFDGQMRLHRARVLVVGCGALGSVAAWYCAATGIGTIGLADDDTIALHNLHRQPLYTPDEIGHKKTDILFRKLKAFAPALDIQRFPAIDSANAYAVCSQYDVVIDGTDTFFAKFLLNDICSALRLPFVYGSVYQLESQCALFDMQKATLRTLFPHEPPPTAVPDCAGSGTLGVVTSLTALWQVQLALAYLLGWQPLRANVLFLWNMKTLTMQEISLADSNDTAL